jgi:hypothetical protein
LWNDRLWRKAAVQRKTWVDETLLVYDILVCVDQKLFFEQSGAAWRLVTVIGVWLILKSSWRVASLIRPPTIHIRNRQRPRVGLDIPFSNFALERDGLGTGSAEAVTLGTSQGGCAVRCVQPSQP